MAGVTQADNAFTAISDLARAQALSDEFVAWPWQQRLDRLADWVNPWFTGADALFRRYYWSVRESEYATDVLLTGDYLARIYPRLLHHAIETFGPADILRFLGMRVTGRFQSRRAPRWCIVPRAVECATGSTRTR